MPKIRKHSKINGTIAKTGPRVYTFDKIHKTIHLKICAFYCMQITLKKQYYTKKQRGHRSQLEGTPTDKLWDNLSFKKNSDQAWL